MSGVFYAQEKLLEPLSGITGMVEVKSQTVLQCDMSLADRQFLFSPHRNFHKYLAVS